MSCLERSAFAQPAPERLSPADGIRIREFYRLASAIQDQIWPHWSQTPAPVLLVTPDNEFLTHHPNPPNDFRQGEDGFYVRPRQFPVTLEASFPAFGPPSVIIIGQPSNTASKTSTPWVIVLMHEHFHQMQNAMPGYFQAVSDLGLSRGDKTARWMLEYPFPYEKPEVAQAFGGLRDQLLATVNETDQEKFRKDAALYVVMRKKFLSQLSADDHKYLSFQLWQEGIARYTQIKAAEAAASYKPTAEYVAVADYEPFNVYAGKARAETLHELQTVDISKAKRGAIYPFGAVEGLLLDRLNPQWKEDYWKQLLTTDGLFEQRSSKEQRPSGQVSTR